MNVKIELLLYLRYSLNAKIRNLKFLSLEYLPIVQERIVFFLKYLSLNQNIHDQSHFQ